MLASVLGQATIPGTTAGYVVAANGQQVSPVNGPQAAQTVTSCSPCVILGLTPSLLAQFTTRVPWLRTRPETFPNSGAPSSFEYSAPFKFSLSAAGKTTVSWSGATLLDTGTPNMSLNGPPSVSVYQNKQLGVADVGTILSVAGGVTGAAVSSQTALTTGTNELYTVRLGTSGTLQTLGLPFFLQNSVLFDLNGQAIGYTSNFVTDAPIVTPLNVTSASVPLGLAGVISGPGGVFIGAGGSATLSADNTYTGPTVVSAGGQLFVVGPGSIAHSSGLTVDQGGVVGGAGILPTSVINGTLSPGSFGTVTVKGNLTFGPGGTYLVEVSPTAADYTRVSGTAMLAGTAIAAFWPDTYKRAHYTILHADGGLSGTMFGALATINLPRTSMRA